MNAVIYARYSSHNQTETSIEGQLKVCYDYAKQHNYNIINEYIDRAMSGTSDNRPQFKQMIQDSSKKQFQGVLVYQLDRFARNREDSATYKGILRRNGVKVYSARENINDDASGILMESVLEGMAEYYSAELSQKVKRGMDINAQKCYYNGGSVPLGLKLIPVEEVNGPMGKKVIKKQYAIDEIYAPIVQTIFNMYSNNATISEIIKYLNERNIKTSRGNEFNKNSLNKILKNKKYIGIYSYNDIENKDGIPSIIDENTFYKVQDKLKINKKAPSRAKAKIEYLLTTKLFCGTCQEMMTGYSGTSETKKLHCYYRCKNKDEHKCSRKNVKKDYIEDLVVNKARDMLTDENIDKIANAVYKTALIKQDNSKLKQLQREIVNLEKQKDSLLDSLAICNVDSVKKSIFEKIAKYDERQKELNSLLKTEKNNTTNISVPQIKEFLNHIKSGDINDIKCRKMLINVLIYRVYIYDNNITIIFTTQDELCEIEVPSISQIESSFLGNSSPPR